MPLGYLRITFLQFLQSAKVFEIGSKKKSRNSIQSNIK